MATHPIKKQTAEVIIKSVKFLLNIDLEIYSDGNLNSADKISFYRACSKKLKELSSVKSERLKIQNESFNLGEWTDKLERLDLLESIIENELSVIEIESNISNKDEYCKMFLEMERISTEQNIRDSKECDLYLQQHIQKANEIISRSSTKDTDKTQLHGLLSQIHGGFRTIEQKAKLYVKLRDFIIRLQ